MLNSVIFPAQNVGLHTCGSLRLATNPTRVDEMHYQMTRAKWHVNPQYLVSPDEIRELHPLLNMEDVSLWFKNNYSGNLGLGVETMLRKSSTPFQVFSPAVIFLC